MLKIILKLILYFFYPLSILYQFLFFFKKSITKSNVIPNALVFSVGNLSVGGTGKTPFVIYLSRLIQTIDDESKITILSRGYGGKNSKIGMEVEPDSDPTLCGDEPLLIKKSLKNIEMIIGRNRFGSYAKFSKWQMKQRKLILLDDGFQHFSIDRDMDIVLIDSIQKLGTYGFTLPIGILREKYTSLKRAQVVIFTKSDLVNLDELNELKEQFLSVNPNLKIYHSYYKPGNLISCSGELKLDYIFQKKVFLFSGIAEPNSFIRTIENINPKSFQFRRFKDHHSYSEKEILQVLKTSIEYDIAICTEKDFVKIRKLEIHNDMLKNLHYLHIEARIKEESDFIRFLKEKINANP